MAFQSSMIPSIVLNLHSPQKNLKIRAECSSLELCFNLKSSVDRFSNGQSHEIKQIFFQMPLTLKVNHAMMLIAHCSLLFSALQFVVITSYYASLRLVKNKQRCTLSTIQLGILCLKKKGVIAICKSWCTMQ